MWETEFDCLDCGNDCYHLLCSENLSETVACPNCGYKMIVCTDERYDSLEDDWYRIWFFEKVTNKINIIEEQVKLWRKL